MSTDSEITSIIKELEELKGSLTALKVLYPGLEGQVNVLLPIVDKLLTRPTMKGIEDFVVYAGTFRIYMQKIKRLDPETQNAVAPIMERIDNLMRQP